MNNQKIEQVFQEVLNVYKYEPPTLVFGNSIKDIYGTEHKVPYGMAMNFKKNVIFIIPDIICGWTKKEVVVGMLHELGHFLHAFWLFKMKEKNLISQKDVDEYSQKSGEDIADYLAIKMWNRLKYQ